MARLRVHNLSMSLDGFVAGPDQSRDDPLGKGGEDLHTWIFETRYGREMTGRDGGSTGTDNDYMLRGDDAIGATIMGRNMFGPIRGEWTAEEWKGWWGDEPPYHHDVFVLTHHAHDDIPMQGGTTFHFVTEGIETALERAVESAGGRDVRIGGGAATVQQYLKAGLIDELHVAIAPILLGSGARLFENLGDSLDSYQCKEFVGSAGVTHAVLTKR
jgi:dihydrofolate reductase